MHHVLDQFMKAASNQIFIISSKICVLPPLNPPSTCIQRSSPFSPVLFKIDLEPPGNSGRGLLV
jgi:hypothetical protein